MENIELDFDKDKVTYRIAVIGDYERVLDIDRNVYEKFDYVPGMYHEFCHNPDCKLFVAEYQGKVVAFLGTMWLENNVYLLFAGRIHPDYKKKGIMKLLEEYGKQYYAALKPIFKATGDWTSAAVERLMKNNDMKFLLFYRCLSYKMISQAQIIHSIGTFSHALIQEPILVVPNSQYITDDAVTRFRQYTEHILYSFCYIPFDVTVRNINNMAKVFPTYVSLGNTINDADIEAISSLSCVKCIDDIYRVDFWYTGSANVDLWKVHTRVLMKKLLHLLPCEKVFKLQFNFQDGLSSTTIIPLLSPYFGPQQDSNRSQQTICYLYEKYINMKSKL